MTFLSLFAVLVFNASCFALPVEEPPLAPPVLASGIEATYQTVEVDRGDVPLSKELSASYVAAREETVSFDIGDEYIASVNVDEGDTVQVGDVIAELNRDYFLGQLKRIDEDETWVNMELSQLDERHELTLSQAALAGEPVDETPYLNERAALLARLDEIAIRKEYMEAENERRILRANIDGIITYVITFEEGDTSTADRAIATIADQSNSVFMVRGQEIKNLTVGGHYDLTIDGNVYDAVVVDPEEVGIERAALDEMYLIVTDEEQPVVTARTYARVTLMLDEATDVLFLPSRVISKANARVFVYILENGIRTIRDIEIGLEGNNRTVITSGLSEGEAVIMD
jgi:multidrug efflux pump subunit AcrA (membrane-fusion protein)